MRSSIFAILAGLLVIAGCGAGEELISKPAQVPVGLDLSGQWLLSSNSGSNQRDARETLVYAFLETGKSVKVTQTQFALFVSFDRSVVEEYRFGENRKVSVGPIDASRVSGWEGESYVIETLDKDGAKLVDSYQLDNDGQRLTRTIEIWSDNRQQLSIEQAFDRL